MRRRKPKSILVRRKKGEKDLTITSTCEEKEGEGREGRGFVNFPERKKKKKQQPTEKKRRKAKGGGGRKRTSLFCV